MTGDQSGGVISIIAWLAIIIIFGVLFAVFRKRSDDNVDPQIEIARIVEPNLVQRASVGFLGLILFAFTVVSFLKYFTADTVYQQMVALLLWIGNSIFWGVLLLANLISQGRTSTIYRDETPNDRRD